MPHLDAPAPPTPPRAPETSSESQYPDPKGLIVDPIPIQKQLMRMLAASIALAIIAQLMLWGLALLNHRWTQSGPKSGAARWAASQVFAGEKVDGAAGLIAKFKNQTLAPGTQGGYFLAKVAEGSLDLLAKTGDEDAATALCLMPIALGSSPRSVDAARSACAVVLAANPNSNATQSHKAALDGAWQFKLASFIERQY